MIRYQKNVNILDDEEFDKPFNTIENVNDPNEIVSVLRKNVVGEVKPGLWQQTLDDFMKIYRDQITRGVQPVLSKTSSSGAQNYSTFFWRTEYKAALKNFEKTYYNYSTKIKKREFPRFYREFWEGLTMSTLPERIKDWTLLETPSEYLPEDKQDRKLRFARAASEAFMSLRSMAPIGWRTDPLKIQQFARDYVSHYS